MKFIKKERFPKNSFTFGSSCEYWDLGNGFIADVENYDDEEDVIHICLHNENNICTLSPAERGIKDEKFARKIQEKIENIKIDYGIDAVYMICSKNQLESVLTEIERHINNKC